jgi:hypothetical protein
LKSSLILSSGSLNTINTQAEAKASAGVTLTDGVNPS